MPPRKSSRGSTSSASSKGKGGGTAPNKGKKAAGTRKARAGANKATEPVDVPQRLDSPEEGYWDGRAWVDARKPGDGDAETDEEEEWEKDGEDTQKVAPSKPASPIRKRAPVQSYSAPPSTPHTPEPAPAPAPYPSPVTADRGTQSHHLSPRSRALFNGVPYPEPLFQDHSRSPTPSGEALIRHELLTPHSGGRGSSRLPRADTDDHAADVPLPYSHSTIAAPRPPSYIPTPGSSRRVTPSGRRVVLGEIRLPTPSHRDSPSPRPQAQLTKHKTYSRRVPYAYRLPSPPEQPYSQPEEDTPTHHATSRASTQQQKPSFDNYAYQDPFSRDCTPPPAQPRKRRRIVSTSSPETGRSGEEERYDRRGADYSYDRHYEAEGEPDLNDDLFAADSPLPSDFRDPSQLIPFTTALGERRFFLPPGARTPPAKYKEYHPNPLPVILEEDVPARLRFGRNHRRRYIIPRRRRRGPIVPQHQPLPLPRALPRIPVRDFLAAYATRAKPFPFSTQLLESGHRAVKEKQWRRGRAGAGGRVNPAIPRIVHASDVPDSTIDAPPTGTASARSQPRPPPVPSTPAERFHHAAPGRIALTSRMGRARGRATGHQHPGNLSLPALQFATHTPDMGGWYAAPASRQTLTRANAPAPSSSVVTTPATRPQRVRPPPSGTPGLRFPDPTQGPLTDVEFWDSEADTEGETDFEPESGDSGGEADLASVEDTVVVVMDNGEEVALTRAEVDDFAVIEALAEFAEPLPSSELVPDDIEGFDGDDGSAAAGTQHRRVLGEITPPNPAQLSGIHMTDYLLRLADRAEPPREKSARAARLDERRARTRLTAERVLASSAPLVAHGSSQSSLRSRSNPPSSHPHTQSQRLPPNPFAHAPAGAYVNQVPPTPQWSGGGGTQVVSAGQGHTVAPPPPSQRPLTQRTMLHSTLTQRSASQRPSKSATTTTARLTAAFKPPSRLDAPPPPEPTLADLLQDQLARSFPAFAAAKPREPVPPPVPLGARIRSRNKSSRG